MLDKLSGWLIGRSGTSPRAPNESAASGGGGGVPVVDVRTTDGERVPPRQVLTKKWPVLHYGGVPRPDLETWRFEVGGLVERPLSLTYDQLRALPRQRTVCDIHCVTRWSRLDNVFEGVSVRELLGRAGVRAEAKYAIVHAEEGFTTNLALDDLARPENLLAWCHNGEELSPEHGWPLRLVVPHLYFWKSAKWVRGLELLDFDFPGFWEQNGYHMRGDPWREERYGGTHVDQRLINQYRNASKKQPPEG